jgi:hypothetical protein
MGTTGVMTSACDFPPCPNAASRYLRLWVEGSDTVLSACERHAEWLQSYEAMDTQVRIVDTSHVDPHH